VKYPTFVSKDVIARVPAVTAAHEGSRTALLAEERTSISLGNLLHLEYNFLRSRRFRRVAADALGSCDGPSRGIFDILSPHLP
jgi:hypothetical protein